MNPPCSPRRWYSTYSTKPPGTQGAWRITGLPDVTGGSGNSDLEAEPNKSVVSHRNLKNGVRNLQRERSLANPETIWHQCKSTTQMLRLTGTKTSSNLNRLANCLLLQQLFHPHLGRCILSFCGILLHEILQRHPSLDPKVVDASECPAGISGVYSIRENQKKTHPEIPCKARQQRKKTQQHRPKEDEDQLQSPRPGPT